ncbi:hypothetical protein SDC9_166837 [bioreactor metagenome]|uniref:Uncharacterized protein n=1 Tax=bioreactor metagenome TaxID=1076179 RepID=A0A645FY43_9ZZZZ
MLPDVLAVKEMRGEGNRGQLHRVGVMDHQQRLLDPGVELRQRDLAIEIALRQQRNALRTAVIGVVAEGHDAEVEVESAQFGIALEHLPILPDIEVGGLRGRAAVVKLVLHAVAPIVKRRFRHDLPLIQTGAHFRILVGEITRLMVGNRP